LKGNHFTISTIFSKFKSALVRVNEEETNEQQF
jgi:hypothetical protein